MPTARAFSPCASYSACSLLTFRGDLLSLIPQIRIARFCLLDVYSFIGNELYECSSIAGHDFFDNPVTDFGDKPPSPCVHFVKTNPEDWSAKAWSVS